MKGSTVIHSDPDIMGARLFSSAPGSLFRRSSTTSRAGILEEFLDDFPTVTREQVIAALEQAKAHLIADARAS
jgi:hypothetical protein